jgi:hypothetical protein
MIYIKSITRVLVAFVIASFAMLSGHADAEESARSATLYKDPQCGCCEEYAKYLERNGFDVTVKPTHDLALIKRQAGVPERLEGCHTTMIDGYVVEGHVPVNTIDRLLTERPDIMGISLPGMPQGSPGMTGRKTEPFTIYEINEGEPRVFTVE